MRPFTVNRDTKLYRKDGKILNLNNKADKSDLNAKIAGGLEALTNVTFGRASDRIYIRFTVSATSFYQLEIYDDGPLVYARSIDGVWATMWSK